MGTDHPSWDTGNVARSTVARETFPAGEDLSAHHPAG
jgi:hypothetical protein